VMMLLAWWRSGTRSWSDLDPNLPLAWSGASFAAPREKGPQGTWPDIPASGLLPASKAGNVQLDARGADAFPL